MTNLLSITILLFLILYFCAPWIISQKRNSVNQKSIKVLSITIPVLGFLCSSMLEPLWLVSLCSPPFLIVWAFIDNKK